MVFRSDKALAEAYEELKHWSRKLDAAGVSFLAHDYFRFAFLSAAWP